MRVSMEVRRPSTTRFESIAHVRRIGARQEVYVLWCMSRRFATYRTVKSV